MSCSVCPVPLLMWNHKALTSGPGRKHLQEALVIAKLHQDVLTGDYARVLYKLSVVLGSDTGNHAESTAHLQEAQAIALSRQSHGTEFPLRQDEITYDRLVYILWR